MSTTPESRSIEAEGDGVVAWSRFAAEDLPALPKMVAVNRAYRVARESDLGLPDDFAAALANAAVEPERLRASLASPTTISVAGGTIEVLDVDLYVPALVPLPTNTRTILNRVYPFGDQTTCLGPLVGPTTSRGQVHGVTVRAKNVEHALARIGDARDYVLSENPLRESIAARGIAMPVTIVYLELAHDDGAPTMPLLATADGSSRVAGAHEVLRLTEARTVHYDFPTNRDSYRRFIGGILGADVSGLPSLEAKRITEKRNALITPARVFLRFTPSHTGNNRYDFARALSAYVGMLHVDPPRPWQPTGKLEAMAESVLTMLRANEALPREAVDYLAGMLTPEEATTAGLPLLRDEQAAYVLSTFLSPSRGVRQFVDQGITDVTTAKTVSHGRRSDVAGELALRATRSYVLGTSDETNKQQLTTMRAPYLRASRLGDYSRQDWRVTGRGPDTLFTDALAELMAEESGSSTAMSARLELAALAQYHLTRFGVLRREIYGNPEADKRGPHEILSAMLHDVQGLRLLHRALVDGRADGGGQAPLVVDETGKVVAELDYDNAAAGRPLRVTDQWLRYEAFPASPDNATSAQIRPEQPVVSFASAKRSVERAFVNLLSEINRLKSVTNGHGGPIVDQLGWPDEATRPLRTIAEEIRDDLVHWTRVSRGRAAPFGFTANDGREPDEDWTADAEPAED